MTDTRTGSISNDPSRCAHVYSRGIGPYLKCTACGEVTVEAVTYDANCPDCEFETHRCGYCGQTLNHTMTHDCPKAYG